MTIEIERTAIHLADAVRYNRIKVREADDVNLSDAYAKHATFLNILPPSALFAIIQDNLCGAFFCYREGDDPKNDLRAIRFKQLSFSDVVVMAHYTLEHCGITPPQALEHFAPLPQFSIEGINTGGPLTIQTTNHRLPFM
jgi:hypothetical protein